MCAGYLDRMSKRGQMINHLKALATCVLVSAMASTQAQTTAASGTTQTTPPSKATRTHKKAAARPSVESQIQ
jgi:hypothetical protein